MTSFDHAREAEGPLPVAIGLTAAIVAVQEDEPLILTVAASGEDARAALPSGPFDPVHHRTFEIGLRAWVAEQTGMTLGYVEQLYTFGDRGRHARAGDRDPHVVSVGYLALTRIAEGQAGDIRGFRNWYEFFPWEDWRGSRPELMETILSGLTAWVEEAPDARSSSGLTRRDRVSLLFRPQGRGLDEENALERYELLYEAGLVEEAWRDGREAALKRGAKPSPLGASMQHDHRRILATAMGRLRAKMKYRPVIFELMPPAFTLTELQRTVEAIAGRHLHKQNFRRLVETSAAVEPTGEVSLKTGGRPAALFHFRRNVLQERPAPGLRVGIRG